jgi:hypothetical protein
MTKLDELLQAAAGLPDSDIAALVGLALRLRVTMAPAGGDLDEETREWLDADFSPPLEPEDWSGVPDGKPVVWDEVHRAFVVIGGKD